MNLSRKLYWSGLVSLLALAASVGATAAPSVARAIIRFEAVANEPFAINLPDTTKISGEYSMITGPQWLSLTSKGILFGSPTLDQVGEHEIYASAIKMGKEYLFHFQVAVKKGTTHAAKLEFKVKVGEILKQDLMKLSGIQGDYFYPSLPKWLKGLESGIIVGEPTAEDVGAEMFAVDVFNGDHKETFYVKVVVTNENPEPKPWLVKTSSTLRIDLENFLGTKGLFRVKGPTWLYLTSTNELVGTPDETHVGTHRVDISVSNNAGTTYYWFLVQVTP